MKENECSESSQKQKMNKASLFLDILKEDIERRMNNTGIEQQIKRHVLYLKKDQNAFMVYDSELSHPDETEVLNLEQFREDIDEFAYHQIIFEHYQVQLSFQDTYDIPQIKFILQPLKILHQNDIPFIIDGNQQYEPHLFANDFKYEQILFSFKKCYFKELAQQKYAQNNNIFLKEIEQSKKKVIHYRNKNPQYGKKILIAQKDLDLESYTSNSHTSLISEFKATRRKQFDFKTNFKPYKQINYQFDFHQKMNNKVVRQQKQNQIENQEQNAIEEEINFQCSIEDQLNDNDQQYNYQNEQSNIELTIIIDDDHDDCEQIDEENNQYSKQSDINFNNLKKINAEKKRLKALIPTNLQNIKKDKNQFNQQSQVNKTKDKNQFNQQSQVNKTNNQVQKEKIKRGRKKGFVKVDEQKRRKKEAFPKREYFIVSDEEDDQDYYKFFKKKITNKHCQLPKVIFPMKQENSLLMIKKQEDDFQDNQKIKLEKQKQGNKNRFE